MYKFFVGVGEAVEAIEAFVEFAHEMPPAFAFAGLLIEGVFEEANEAEAGALEELVSGAQREFEKIRVALGELSFVCFDAFDHIAEGDGVAAEGCHALAEQALAVRDGFESFGEMSREVGEAFFDDGEVLASSLHNLLEVLERGAQADRKLRKIGERRKVEGDLFEQSGLFFLGVEESRKRGGRGGFFLRQEKALEALLDGLKGVTGCTRAGRWGERRPEFFVEPALQLFGLGGHLGFCGLYVILLSDGKNHAREKKASTEQRNPHPRGGQREGEESRRKGKRDEKDEQQAKGSG